MLHSFDVFDTLITRRTCSPQGIFVLMQNRLTADGSYVGIDEYVRKNFAVLRSNAETLARRAHFRGTAEEITLSQIYDVLALTGRLTREDAARLMRLEKETERKNVVGIRENIEKVRWLLERKEPVICISDMYLDEAAVRAMLMEADPVFADVPVYVSSESKFVKGRRRGDANLFRYAAEQENASFSDWEHTGDNEYTDVFSCTGLGIRGVHYVPERLRPYERRIAETLPHSPAAALAIGTARALRMNEKLVTPAAMTGCSFAGPVLFSYVYWLLSDSMRRGIRRLYFIARDGSIPMKIADIIIEYLRLPIETHYIHGSRRAWRMPAYTGASEELSEIFSLSSYDEIFTVKQFAAVFQITDEELYSFFPEFQKIQRVSTLVCAEMIQQAASCKEFCTYLFQKNEEKRRLLREYLIQEIDASDDRFAFVEMNGSGYSQLMLTRLMRDVWTSPVHTFFFKMDKLYKDENCVFHCFFPRFLDCDILIEGMTRALEEQTVGYCRQKGRVVPVFSGNEGKLLEDYQYCAYEEGITAFSRNFIRAISENGVQEDLSLVDSYMRELLNWTRCREFLYLAEMPFCNNGREEDISDVKRFAPQLTDQQIDEIYLWNTETNPRKWYAGTSLELSLLRCTESQREKIRRYECSRSEYFEPAQDPFLVYPGHEEVPFELLGKQIVIYGAGKYGQKLYSEALKRGSTVVQWLDAGCERLKAAGLPVTGSIEDIGLGPYDRVIVAILNLYLAEKIKRQLIHLGVPEEKIYCPVIEALSI